MNDKKKNLVVVALSGGVDSAVCLCLLKNQNLNLQAIYMRNWDSVINNDVLGQKSSKKGCEDLNELKIVQDLCAKFDVPLKVYNFVEDYWNNVFQVSLDQLEQGLTPNPDVLCNSQIKFGKLLEAINQDFGSNVKIATGHYAKVIFENNKYYLGTSQDKNKDQTYFLNQLNQANLARIVFPLADIKSKEEVRDLAKKFGLQIWNKPDSTGICFIGERKYNDFLKNYLTNQKGEIIDIKTKKVVGSHQGLFFYTLGQRKNLGLSGNSEPYYVCAKNTKKNQLFVCFKDELEKHFYHLKTKIVKMNWISDRCEIDQKVYIRFRHTGKLVLAKITDIINDEITLEHQLTFTTAPGQYVVLYNLDKTICYGGGIYENKKQMEYEND